MAEQWNARVEAEKLAKLYDADLSQQSYHLLLLGGGGTGKTSLLATARKPVHIDSFDKGGTKVLADQIRKGEIVVDTRYENEDPLDPKAFELWRKEFEVRLLRKYFQHIGTYCLDSCTAWAEAIMSYVLKADDSSKAGTAPVWNRHYTPQKVHINNYLTKILTLPCDIIVTGHLAPEYESRIIEGEEVRVLERYKFQTTGQGEVIIPLKFDEIYIATLKDSPRGQEFTLLTQKDGKYTGKTRIGSRGKFAKYEKADVKELLKKVGWSTKDKPLLNTLFKDEQPKVEENEDAEEKELTSAG